MGSNFATGRTKIEETNKKSIPKSE